MKEIYKKIKRIGINNTIKIAYNACISRFVPKHYENKWKRTAKMKGYSGISKEKREIPLIVSLTTYPGRINIVHHVIETLLMQSIKPDKIILWLANEQFPNKEKDLPENLLCLCDYGLTIEWCKDIRSYKKLIPTINKYPNSVIITTDDDMYYHKKMVERLYKAYLKDDTCIHCHRVTKFSIENGEYKTKSGGYDIYPHPSYLHKLTGCSGVCYPPNKLYKDITNDKLFMELAPTNDDIWFWLMGALGNMRCNVVKHNYPALHFVKESQNESLCSINDSGEKLFWIQFKNMLDHYPKIDKILNEEWKKESK